MTSQCEAGMRQMLMNSMSDNSDAFARCRCLLHSKLRMISDTRISPPVAINNRHAVCSSPAGHPDLSTQCHTLLTKDGCGTSGDAQHCRRACDTAPDAFSGLARSGHRIREKWQQIVSRSVWLGIERVMSPQLSPQFLKTVAAHSLRLGCTSSTV